MVDYHYTDWSFVTIGTHHPFATPDDIIFLYGHRFDVDGFNKGYTRSSKILRIEGNIVYTVLNNIKLEHINPDFRDFLDRNDLEVSDYFI